MIADLKPYPVMKDSGVEWLGDVPEHWSTPRTKTCFRLSIEKSGQNHGMELLSIYTHIGVRPRKDLEEKGNKASSTDDYWVVRAGDIICNKLLAWMGAIGVSHYDGVTSPAYDILRPIVPLEPDYYHHLFRTPRALQQFKIRSRGIMDMRLRLYFDQFGQIPIAYPPLPEQAAIVRYLDYVDRRVRRLVGAKRKLIALLTEQRKIVTREAIESSGTTSHRLEVVAERIERPIDRLSENTYTPVGLYNRGRGIFLKKSRKGDELGDSDFFWIEEGDLVISGQFAWEGAIALAGKVEAGCVASHRYPIVRGKPGVLNSGFLLAFFQTDWGQLLLDHHSRGAAGRNRPLNARTLMKDKIHLPPYEDQQRIADMVGLESRVRQQVEGWIQLLHEYRTRLIADVVTGKLDVREAAANLPDEQDEPEPMNSGDVIADDLVEVPSEPQA